MNLVIVSASQRVNSQSAKVADHLQGSAKNFESIKHIELCKYQLPYWDGELSSKEKNTSHWPLISEEIEQADAFVLITPEWGGMATAILKNFLLMSESEQTAHKPALLISVVNGISGAYPIAELRMNAFKNNKMVAIPEHLIIRNVEQVLNQNQQKSTEREINLIERINYSMHMLAQYSRALKPMRLAHNQERYPNQQKYLYGM